MATNWTNIVARCKFLVASLYNVNDAAHSMARSIRFDCLKISQTEVGINLEVHANWLCLCDLAHFYDKSKARKDEMFVLTLLFNLNLNRREIWSPKWRPNQNF